MTIITMMTGGAIQDLLLSVYSGSDISVVLEMTSCTVTYAHVMFTVLVSLVLWAYTSDEAVLLTLVDVLSGRGLDDTVVLLFVLKKNP